VKLRHPLTGAVYEDQGDGSVRVEAADGSVGIFRHDGAWLRGALRQADPHLLGFVAGPALGSGRLPAAAAPAAPPRAPGVAVPDLGSNARRPDRPGSTHDGANTRRNREMDLGLDGRRIAVTAASRGIGLAIARTFADQGCHLAICARGAAGLEAARKDLEARGASVFARALDVGDREALGSFIRDGAQALGGLDVYVSNASGGAGAGEKAWRACFEVDVMGAVRGVEAALPFLKQSDAASVVFIGSTAALEYLGIPQPYNAMKAALIAHASDLSQALAKDGVRVNVVSPGPIYFEGGSWEMIERAMPAMFKAALAQCAIGRMGTPEEVARAVVFLASPAASLITGANLVTDGGFTRRTAY
jgi:NAD(P)-dependent dehydrogenase (short-subunit alcohol dehydrogenase family)